MNGWERGCELLPRTWRSAAEAFSDQSPEEIRLRCGRRPTVLLPGGEKEFMDVSVTEETLKRVMEIATDASIHTAATALAEGYLSYRGLRIGVCGAGIMKDEKFCGFRRYSSLAIRIPRECRGICDHAAQLLTEGGFQNTLVIGSPGEGKTTALRELIRRITDMGFRIGVSDERNELAAADGASAQFDLGRYSDVLTGVPKVEGAMMLLRGMNPQVLAMDEITRQRDLEAIRYIFGCGVGLMASVHGKDLDEIQKRAGYRELLNQGIFTYALTVERRGRQRRYKIERIGS